MCGHEERAAEASSAEAAAYYDASRHSNWGDACDIATKRGTELLTPFDKLLGIRGATDALNTRKAIDTSWRSAVTCIVSIRASTSAIGSEAGILE